MMSQDIKIVIDANCNMHYCAFYIFGFKEIYGKNVTFSFKEFLDINHDNHCLLIKIFDKNDFFNVAIDFHDTQKIDKNVLLWSNHYAKINLHQTFSKKLLMNALDDNKALFDDNWSKIFSIPSSFGIRVFNFAQTVNHIFYLIKNQNFKALLQSKKLILDVIRMYVKRLPLSNYFYKQFHQNYVFLIASIWHKTTDYVNLSRANFIRACKANAAIQFEGGLVDIGYECNYINDLNDLKTGKSKIKLSDYIHKTQKSNFVFNCPSVGYCHGWKLSEYLCLGKAIISTEISNELPVNLQHGLNIHLVENNLDSISKAVKYLIENPDYVKKLEKGALEYWKNHCDPGKIVETIILKTLQ